MQRQTCGSEGKYELSVQPGDRRERSLSKKQLQHGREAIHKEKLQMLWWIKSGQIQQQQEIGQRLGRDTSTISRWLQKYHRNPNQANFVLQHRCSFNQVDFVSQPAVTASCPASINKALTRLPWNKGRNNDWSEPRIRALQQSIQVLIDTGHPDSAQMIAQLLLEQSELPIL